MPQTFAYTGKRRRCLAISRPPISIPAFGLYGVATLRRLRIRCLPEPSYRSSCRSPAKARLSRRVCTAVVAVPFLAWAASRPFPQPRWFLATRFCAALAAAAPCPASAASAPAISCVPDGAPGSCRLRGRVQLINAGTASTISTMHRPVSTRMHAISGFIVTPAILVATGLRPDSAAATGLAREISACGNSLPFSWRCRPGRCCFPRYAVLRRGPGIRAAIQIVNLGNIVLVAASAPPELLERVSRRQSLVWQGRADPCTARTRRDGSVLPDCGHGCHVDLRAAQLFVYENHPHVPDEVSYLYEARTLLR